MEKSICKKQANYHIVDTGPVCVIYAQLETSRTWLGTLIQQGPDQFKLLLPKDSPSSGLPRFLSSTNKQTILNWLIDINEIHLSAQPPLNVSSTDPLL